MAVAVLGALALKADGAINHEVADAGVAGSENGEADDDTCAALLVALMPRYPRDQSLPRGINSGGILLSLRSLCETVWPVQSTLACRKHVPQTPLVPINQPKAAVGVNGIAKISTYRLGPRPACHVIVS